MFVHFAFGALGKQGKIEEQTYNVIEHILKQRRLKVSKCTEFVPRLPKPGAKRIPREMFKPMADGLAAPLDLRRFNELPDDNTIRYLPVDVPMICFIKIAFNQLGAAKHSDEYGKFGIVLTDSFLKAKGIKPVHYYSEQSLATDP